MPTQKKFLIYLIVVIIFFAFSQLMISIAINATYKYKSLDVKSDIITRAEVQASSISGFAKGKVKNNTDSELQNKYVKIDCYSKNDTLIGTKYAKIDKLGTNEEKEFEVHFNFNKIEKAVLDIVNEEALTDMTEEENGLDLQQDNLKAIVIFTATITVLKVLCFI